MASLAWAGQPTSPSSTPSSSGPTTPPQAAPKAAIRPSMGGSLKVLSWRLSSVGEWFTAARNHCRFSIADGRYSKLETGNSKLGKDAAATHWSRISIFEFRFSAPSIGNRQAGIADSRLTVDDCRCSKVETANSKLGKDAAATHWSRVSIFCSSNRQSLRFCLLLTAYCLLPTAYWLAAAARFDGGDAGLAERTFGRIVVLNG